MKKQIRNEFVREYLAESNNIKGLSFDGENDLESFWIKLRLLGAGNDPKGWALNDRANL